MADILLAEDNDAIRRAVRQILENGTGWRVCAEVCDGVAAVEVAKESSSVEIDG